MALPFDSYWRVQGILEARGVAWQPSNFSLEDTPEKNGLMLGHWDAALGARPTDREIQDTTPYVRSDSEKVRVELNMSKPTTAEEGRMAKTLEAQHRAGVTPTIEEMSGLAAVGVAVAGETLRQAKAANKETETAMLSRN